MNILDENIAHSEESDEYTPDIQAAVDKAKEVHLRLSRAVNEVSLSEKIAEVIDNIEEKSNELTIRVRETNRITRLNYSATLFENFATRESKRIELYGDVPKEIITLMDEARLILNKEIKKRTNELTK